MPNRRVVIFLFAVLLAGFVAGLVELFELRTGHGDVFPPYSTFRADPLGTKALYESLEQIKQFRVSRNFASMDKIRDPHGTLLFLGMAPGPFFASPKESLLNFPKWAARGNRVVVSFLPLGADQKTMDAGAAGKALQFNVGFEPARNPRNRDLYFKDLPPEWKVLISTAGHPRIIAKDFGRGTIILCADSYLFSNEALLKDRQTRLIAQLMGDARNIVFDEAHNGMREQASMGTLARRYRLHGFAAGLLLVAGLFVWKSSARFLPVLPDEDRLDSVSGKDAASGLVKLLKRSVSVSQLASVCLAEWKRSPQLQERCGKQKLDRIEAAVKAQNDPVQLYRTIHQILAERN